MATVARSEAHVSLATRPDSSSESYVDDKIGHPNIPKHLRCCRNALNNRILPSCQGGGL